MPQKVKNVNKKSLPRLKDTEVTMNTESDGEENAIESTSPAVNNTVEKFSLYVRGAAWIKDRDNAEARLKEIESRIQHVRYPRQKSADFCYIDFASIEDRDQSYEQLKSHSEIKVRSVTTDVPKLLNKRQKIIVEKREAKKETRKLIRQIKKKEKFNANITERPNQVVIVNLPRQVTVTELKQQYPNAVKVNVKNNPKAKHMHTAIITFPDPRSALTASKESILLHGQKIKVILNKDASFKETTKPKKKGNAKRKSTSSNLETEEPSPKIPKIKAN